ncbi:hypothetical protein BASA81_003940 [Batrachochytrium salamandrivorans]|nr:hypothetical protein BASA81_003940 [Batrachochytrium salamandrivorans]
MNPNCSCDISFVVQSSRFLESLLESEFQSWGTGLRDRILNAKGLDVTESVLVKLNIIVRVRNGMVHQMGYENKFDRPRFKNDFDDVKEALDYIIKQRAPSLPMLVRLRLILSKLSPNRVVTSIEDILQLEIKSFADLKSIVSEIHGKALREPHLNPELVMVCRGISDMTFPFDVVEQNNQWFGVLPRSLLDGPKGNFTGPNSVGFTSKQEVMEECKTRTRFERLFKIHVQKEFESNFSTDLTARNGSKQRMLRSVALIGEMWVQKFFSMRIVDICIAWLLGCTNPEEVSWFLDTEVNRMGDILESLAELLTKVGKQPNSQEVDSCRVFFLEIYKSDKLPSMYCALVSDLLENIWGETNHLAKRSTVVVQKHVIAPSRAIQNNQFGLLYSSEEEDLAML